MPATTHLRPHHHPVQFGAGALLLLLAGALLLHPDLCDNLARALPRPMPRPMPWTGISALATVVPALMIFITGYRAILSPRKGAVVWLGVAYLGVGLLASLRLVATPFDETLYANGPVAGLAWIDMASRLLAAGALLVYVTLPAIPDVSTLRKRFAVGLVVVLALIAGTQFLRQPDWMPPLTYRSGLPTPMLGWLHGGLLGLSLATLLVIWLRRQTLNNECLPALAFAAAFTATSALLLVAAPQPFSPSQEMVAGAYQVVALLYVFHATVNEAFRRPLERLEMLHARENATLTAAPDGVLWVNDQGTIVLANPAMQALSGYEPRELLGQNLSVLLPPHLRKKHGTSIQDYFQTPRSRAMGMMDLSLYRKDGGLQPVDISLGYWQVEGTPHAIAYIRDLTERKRLEESLRHQATHDELTGLANRWLLQLQLQQALVRAERAHQRVAVLFLDLDHFKAVNDTFGHAVGDALLAQVSRRIQGVLRTSDTLARMGGDEFAVLLSELDAPDEAVTVAVKILNCLQEPFDVASQKVYGGCSIGLSYYPDDASDRDTLLRYADMAMYQAKQSGRGSYACYSQELDRRTHADMMLYGRLKAALANQLLTLHFQPQVDLSSGRLVGAEVLLRWTDPELGEVSPGRFIPLAEATGLILPIADWVLEAVGRQIAALQSSGRPIRLAMNVSAHQLQHGQLAEKIRTTLARTGAHARWLELEITETVAMTQPRHALEQLKALVDLGCSVSLDDFGTGYSSLAYLKTMPVSKIKIDRSFVQDLTTDPNDDVIVRTLIGMARNLGLDVIAEGVETGAQRDRLSLYGCETGQGYLYHRPMPLSQFEGLLDIHFAGGNLLP